MRQIFLQEAHHIAVPGEPVRYLCGLTTEWRWTAGRVGISHGLVLGGHKAQLAEVHFELVADGDHGLVLLLLGLGFHVEAGHVAHDLA